LWGVAEESLTGAACQRHRGILGELTKRNVKLMVAEFEFDLIRSRIRKEGRSRKAKGRVGGRRSRYKPNQAKRLLELNDAATYTQTRLAELFVPR
jgi:DNA invertase Pin-like site-specific DNA recombinase